mgnify:CR=1 FL=1|tara:strand:+ start:1171 stop:1635 length:465 start_codon:yes stop_codon:yes gene_type:complete
MGIVSEIESYFVNTGKIRCYTDKVANNSDVVSIQIPVNGTQRIYLPQNSLLDSRKIRSLQVIAEDEQFYGFTPTGTTIENIPVAALPEFIFTFAMNNEEKVVTPFACCNRPINNGKFNFIDSNPGSHRIGDCFIDQIGGGAYSGKIITLKFWYD